MFQRGGGRGKCSGSHGRQEQDGYSMSSWKLSVNVRIYKHRRSRGKIRFPTDCPRVKFGQSLLDAPYIGLALNRCEKCVSRIRNSRPVSFALKSRAH